VRSETVHVRGPDVQVQALPSGLDVTRYTVMADPLSAEALQETDADASPAIAVAPLGWPGRPAGLAGFDGSDAGLEPRAFTATTVNVYPYPLYRPWNVQLVAEPSAVVQVSDRELRTT
jgi:hypothetical protein